jgi:hypothetical protein
MAVLTPVTEAGIAAGICSVLEDTGEALRKAAFARDQAADELSWLGFVKRVDEVVRTAIRAPETARARPAASAGPRLLARR